MKAFLSETAMLARKTAGDAILVLVCAVPFIAGAFIRFGIPLMETLLDASFGTGAIFAPWQGLLASANTFLGPIMFCAVSALVMLEEIDDGTARYLTVTPPAMNGYLASRVLIPALAGCLSGFLCVLLFTPQTVPISILLPGLLPGTAQGIIAAMLIVSLSSNKLEGMAVSKLAGFMVLSVAVPFVVAGPARYAVSFAPLFWTGRMIQSGNLLFLLPALAVCAAWIVPLWLKFRKKFV